MFFDRRGFLIATAGAAALAVALPAAFAADANEPWAEILRRARGQKVYFNAWAGDEAISRYLGWAAAALRRRLGVQLIHVRINDVAEAVTRVLAEQKAGRDSDGSIDLLWLNGENFAALRNAGLLHGPWADGVPNAKWIDRLGNPTTVTDVTLPTAGYELAWGTSRYTFFYDSARIAAPPDDAATLLAWVRANRGRFTYPQPPQFHGTSFLKQLLLTMHTDRARFQRPAGADFDTLTRPLWQWLDAAHPLMWRQGRSFPASGPAQRRLLGDGEVDWAVAFNSAEASRSIASGEFPASVRSLRFRAGALANSHFLAIPYNARAIAGAKAVANFLLSPEAQARKSDESRWGDATVIAVEKLPPDERARFARLKRGPATLPASGGVIAEPHASWTLRLERVWSERYRAG